MLTKKQIKKLARRNKVPAHTQEREYIQNLFLYSLYPSEKIVFKGGTALRLVYGSNRFSEDLDFNSYTENTPELLKKVVKKLSDFGVECEIKDEKKTEVGYSFRVVYKGPLYMGKEISRGSIELDASLRREKIKKIKKLVSSPYDEIGDFLITVMNLRHIFAEKIRALVIRGKPRDLYDVWTLSEKGIKVDKNLINRKMSLYDKKFKMSEFKKSIKNVEKYWEQDMDTLLPFVPDFNKVSKKVISEFEERDF